VYGVRFPFPLHTAANSLREIQASLFPGSLLGKRSPMPVDSLLPFKISPPCPPPYLNVMPRYTAVLRHIKVLLSFHRFFFFALWATFVLSVMVFFTPWGSKLSLFFSPPLSSLESDWLFVMVFLFPFFSSCYSPSSRMIKPFVL